ncbi:MAG: hypothetical protein M1839_000350 [Geoglossum umbratile]|nr:MAG: hypothetical protein M1839_000350 [Geoglossum umbratile]
MPFFDNIVGQGAQAEVFTFSATVPSSPRFSFPRVSSPRPTQPPVQNSRKRHRPLADIDGEGKGGFMKKKRRLRLMLITSRLSRPFSAPPTHIVDRGSSKIAVLAKGKAFGRNMLRKAAIMNRVKKHIEALEAKGQTLVRRHDSFAQILRQQFIPLPPSPLGISKYDMLDMEDEGCCGEDVPLYSDFNLLEPAEPDYADYDSLPQPRRPPSPPDEKEVEMILEKQRQKELYFVQFT